MIYTGTDTDTDTDTDIDIETCMKFLNKVILYMCSISDINVSFYFILYSFE